MIGRALENSRLRSNRRFEIKIGPEKVIRVTLQVRVRFERLASVSGELATNVLWKIPWQFVLSVTGLIEIFEDHRVNSMENSQSEALTLAAYIFYSSVF